MTEGARKRVLVGANDLLLAGVQRLVIDQLVHLDRARFAPHLVVLMQFPGRETFYDLIPSDVVVHRLSFKGLLDLGEWKKLFIIVKDIRPDVVKTATFFSNTVFLLLRPFFGYAVVAAEHNTVNRKPAWQRLADRLLLPQAYRIVGDSAAVVDFIVSSEGVPRDRFAVIPNGVDLNAIELTKREHGPERGDERKKLGIPEEAFVFFSAGRLVKQKNHVLMLEALAQVRARGSDAYLLIAGEGGLRPLLEKRIAELNLQGRAVLLGERPDVRRFYLLADAFVLTSLHEGFCIVAMEGLAFGLLLISTRVAGVSDYLKEGENGFFTTYDASGIADAWQKVMRLDGAERAAFARSGEETANDYSVERYGARINELLWVAATAPR